MNKMDNTVDKKKKSRVESDACGNVFGCRLAAAVSDRTDTAHRQYAAAYAHSGHFMRTDMRLEIRIGCGSCNAHPAQSDLYHAADVSSGYRHGV